jgi:hypothetical protein
MTANRCGTYLVGLCIYFLYGRHHSVMAEMAA